MTTLFVGCLRGDTKPPGQGSERKEKEQASAPCVKRALFYLTSLALFYLISSALFYLTSFAHTLRRPASPTPKSFADNCPNSTKDVGCVHRTWRVHWRAPFLPVSAVDK